VVPSIYVLVARTHKAVESSDEEIAGELEPAAV